ncbi:MAG: hypothetical protein ACOYT8_06190 [Candidatus Dependentiae bacterium]
MYKIILSQLLLISLINSFSHAMEKNQITLPSIAELKEEFKQRGYNDFEQLAEFLGGKTIRPDLVINAVVFHYIKCNAIFKKSNEQLPKKSHVIKCILSKHPEAIKELQTIDIFKKYFDTESEQKANEEL